MYVKAVLRCGHSVMKKYTLGTSRSTRNYIDVARYMRVKDFDEFLERYKTFPGVKGNFPVLSYTEITREEYIEGVKNQRKDLYIHCKKDENYKREVIFAS